LVALSRNIPKHKEGTLAYIKEHYTNAIIEGFNSRFRMIPPELTAFTVPKRCSP